MCAGIRPQDNPYASLYPALAQSIEDTVAKTGKKVAVRGCSGGTINGYAFLMSQTKEWRQKHIMAFVAVAPVWGGTISSMKSILYGPDQAKGDSRCLYRAVSTLLPSVLWMWPHPGEGAGEWNKTEVLVQSASKNYTAYDLDELLTDLGLPESQKIYDIEKHDYLDRFEPPMIDTYVFYGYGEYQASQSGSLSTSSPFPAAALTHTVAL